MPAYARIAIPILVVILLGGLVWRGAHSLPHFGSKRNRANVARAQREPFVAPWVRDFKDSLDASARDAAAGKLAAAEIDADSAESFVTLAAFDRRPAPPDFFKSASAQLDRVVQQNASDPSLFRHVASARIGLAEYRSSQETPPPPPVSGRIILSSPRRIAANQTLDPAALDGKYLDATLLPELSEILAPPNSRAFADKIRVENLAITGAAQTLDGIRWRNVTFISTHLRYEGGELSLQNVRFIRCRFGLPEDERGNRIANAIALAPPPGAISIEIPAATK